MATPGTTTIGPTVTIRGKMKSDDDLIIKGRIDAQVTSSKALYIENSGIVKANVQVGSVKVNGILVGNVVAEFKTEIASDGRVVGDILAPDLVIQDGAAFRGRIDMQNFDGPRAVIPEIADEESLTSQISNQVSALDAAASPAFDSHAFDEDDAVVLDETVESDDEASAVADEAAAALDSLLGDDPPSTDPDSGADGKKKKKRRW